MTFIITMACGSLVSINKVVLVMESVLLGVIGEVLVHVVG